MNEEKDMSAAAKAIAEGLESLTPADMLAGLDEGFAERLHPRDRKGKFRNVLARLGANAGVASGNPEWANLGGLMRVANGDKTSGKRLREAVDEAMPALEEWVGAAKAFDEKLHPRGRGGKFAKSLASFGKSSSGGGPRRASVHADKIVAQALHEDFGKLSAHDLALVSKALSMSSASPHYRATIESKLAAARKKKGESDDDHPNFGRDAETGTSSA